MRVAATTAVVAGTAGVVRHHQDQRYQKQADQQAQAAYDSQMAAEYEAQQQQAAVPPPMAPAQPDYMAELERLGQLHQQGVLTDEEYKAKKKQILGL